MVWSEKYGVEKCGVKSMVWSGVECEVWCGVVWIEKFGVEWCGV